MVFKTTAPHVWGEPLVSGRIASGVMAHATSRGEPGPGGSLSLRAADLKSPSPLFTEITLTSLIESSTLDMRLRHIHNWRHNETQLRRLLFRGSGKDFYGRDGPCREAFTDILRELSREDVQQRLMDSEIHHRRPALAGAIVAIEELRSVRAVLESGDTNFGKRFRQAVGVAVRIVMEGRGWLKTGQKWSVGVGEFFSKAEHYVRHPRI